MQYPGFIGPTYAARSQQIDVQRSVNWYPETIESGTGKSAKALVSTPGTLTRWNVGAGPVRGLWAGDFRMFVASAGNMYHIAWGGAVTNRGVIGDDVDHSPVLMFPNGNQLLIISAGQAYLDNGLTISSAGMPAASSGAYLNGYGIIARPNSAEFAISGLYDFSTWDALDFDNKSSHPDHIIRVFVDHDDLWLFGNETSEVWGATDSNPDFPFARRTVVQRGIAAPWAINSLGDGIAYLSTNDRGGIAAYFMQGYQPQRISNHAIEAVWEQYDSTNKAVSYAYEAAGHQFWVVNFADLTWVYDLTERQWHERAWWDGTSIRAHRGRCHAYATLVGNAPSHYVGDRLTGAVHELSDFHLDDNGVAIHRIRQAPHLSDEEINLFYHRFQLDVEANPPSNLDNVSMNLAWSNDGGMTWGTPRTALVQPGYGKEKRCIWRRLGRSRDRVFQVTMTDRGRASLINAYLDVTKGNS